MDDIDVILARQLLGKLRIERHVGLRVVGDLLKLHAEQAAAGIDLVDDEADRLVHRLAINVENAGKVVDRADLDHVIGNGHGRQGGERAGRGRALEQVSAGQVSFAFLPRGWCVSASGRNRGGRCCKIIYPVDPSPQGRPRRDRD